MKAEIKVDAAVRRALVRVQLVGQEVAQMRQFGPGGPVRVLQARFNTERGRLEFVVQFNQPRGIAANRAQQGGGLVITNPAANPAPPPPPEPPPAAMDNYHDANYAAGGFDGADDEGWAEEEAPMPPVEADLEIAGADGQSRVIEASPMVPQQPDTGNMAGPPISGDGEMSEETARKNQSKWTGKMG